jgi:hypothetical protein
MHENFSSHWWMNAVENMFKLDRIIIGGDERFGGVI